MNDLICVREVREEELPRVNEIRHYVQQVHAKGRPDIFRQDFCEELAQHIYDNFHKDNWKIYVAELDGTICGLASVEYIDHLGNAYNVPRKRYHVEEFGVDPAYHRRGVGSALIQFLKMDAKAGGYPKIELDMWEFNAGALAFYEDVGFTTYRRYMELNLEEQG